MVGRAGRASIVLRDPTISRQHARIEVRGDEVHLEDLGSKHGTFVNSRRIRSTTIKPGDLIVFGLAVVLRLEQTDEPPPAEQFDSGPTDYGGEEPSVMTINRRELLAKLPISPAEMGSVDDLAPERDHALRLTRLGALCLELLPRIYGRLTHLSDLASGEPVNLEALRTTVQPLLSSVTRLMEMAVRIAPEPRPPVRLDQVVQESMQRVATDFAQRRLALTSRVPPDLMVQVDPEQMAAVLAGLLTNAGNQSQDEAPVDVVARRGSSGVVLKIVDQGYGYPEEVLAQAFHPLGSNLADPAAIRLWEARRAVIALGGMLTVKSNEGLGAVVRIVLPAVEE